jgi:hypothetical protein
VASRWYRGHSFRSQGVWRVASYVVAETFERAVSGEVPTSSSDAEQRILAKSDGGRIASWAASEIAAESGRECGRSRFGAKFGV